MRRWITARQHVIIFCCYCQTQGTASLDKMASPDILGAVAKT
jgi:hypothetical protein